MVQAVEAVVAAERPRARPASRRRVRAARLGLINRAFKARLRRSRS
jgi:hypothetical protein